MDDFASREQIAGCKPVGVFGRLARHESPLLRLTFSAILIIHVGLLAWGANIQSPTLNEPGHLVAGISNWTFGRFNVFSVNPPLVRLTAALPVVSVGAATDWHNFYDSPGARPEGPLGEDFVAANGERSLWLFTIARWACVPFSVLGLYVCFRWGRDLYGEVAGLIAAAVWCFCPNILAHGQLITSDVAATSLGLAACYTFWLWLKQPTWTRTLTSGLVLGVAELAKMTLVVFLVIWPVMWLVYRWPDIWARFKTARRGGRSRFPRVRFKTVQGEGDSPILLRGLRKIGTVPNGFSWLRELAMLATRMLVALYIVNLGYAFEGTFTRLGEFQFVSATLRGEDDAAPGRPQVGNRFANSWLRHVPVPLPKNYVLGIDLQKRDFESYSQPSYLRGQFSPKGWWYYYLYALAVKVPLGTWVLVGLAAVAPTIALLGKPAVAPACQATVKPLASWRDEFVLLCPAVVILVFVSSQTGFSQHMRYVLPAFPFVFVWIGRLAPALNRKHRILTGMACGALAWSIGSSLWVYPHSLSYFNELAGGPTGGPAHLIHSNVDWGQDLLELKRWLKEHPEAAPLKLAYFGGFDPIHAGIEYTSPKNDLSRDSSESDGAQPIPPGWYAISVNFVRGFPFQICNGDGTKRYLRQDELSCFQKLTPVAMAGYSIYIYHVTGEAMP
jgi:4-amino-4-deoxy-L-arabinose transferase-like glycosyltransferase